MPSKTATTQTPLDRRDRAILRILQRDKKTPQRVVAEAANLSAAAVQRRIVAMEADRVIARDVAVVDPDAVSPFITAIVQVRLKDERAATVGAAKVLFQTTPEVQQCFYVTGGDQIRAGHRRSGHACLRRPDPQALCGKRADRKLPHPGGAGSGETETGIVIP